MRTKLTHSYIEDLIKRAKCNFLKSDQPDKIKEIIMDLNPHILFRQGWRTTYGMASAIEYQSYDRLIMGFKRNDPRYNIDTKKQHLVIEVSDMCQEIKAGEVFELVSHELAHCLDFILRGYILNRKKRKGYHDDYWSNLHRNMGGSGNQFLFYDI